MTDRPEDPNRPPGGYPPPMFAPAAPPEPDAAEPEAAAPPLPLEITASAAASAAPEAAAAPAPAPADALAPAPAPAPAPADEPLLPATFHENDLRTAIGSPAMPEQIRPKRRRERDDDDDTDDDGRPRRRRAALVLGGVLAVGAGIAALAIVGSVKSGRYYIHCDTKTVTAAQGRSFPPWGTSRLSGDEWKPIPIPPSFQCTALETDDPAELGDAYRRMLVERSEALLTAKDKDAAQLDAVAGMLEQALLHARSDSEPHKVSRQAIQRMLGDVGYWRASARLQQATTELADAAKQFEAAAGQLPRFVSDANAWAAHVRRLVEELRAGPSGAKAASELQLPLPAAATAPDRPPAPAGVALPIEPAGSAAGSAEPPPAPDAGVPSGGVLL